MNKGTGEVELKARESQPFEVMYNNLHTYRETDRPEYLYSSFHHRIY